MNLIRPYRLTCIALLKQILYKFKVNWDLISPPVTILQLGASGISGCTTGAKGRGEKGIKCLCVIFIPICVGTNPIK